MYAGCLLRKQTVGYIYRIITINNKKTWQSRKHFFISNLGLTVNEYTLFKKQKKQIKILFYYLYGNLKMSN